jgi:hypothetical protein
LPLLEKIHNESNNSASEEELKQIIRKKLDVVGREIQEIDIFKTWFNPNCAIVISTFGYRIKKYTVRLVVYEPAFGKVKEILFFKRFPNYNPFSGYESLKKAKDKAEKIKAELNDEHPVLVVAKKGFSPKDVIKQFKLGINIKNPDKYLKPLDII